MDLIRKLMETAEAKFQSGDERGQWVMETVKAMVAKQNTQGGAREDPQMAELTAILENGLLPQILETIANASRGMYGINKKTQSKTQTHTNRLIRHATLFGG